LRERQDTEINTWISSENRWILPKKQLTKENEMDLKKICISIVAVYLSICIIILLVLMCFLWPNRSICTSKAMDMKDSSVQLTDPSRDDIIVNKPTEIEQSDPNSITSSPLKQCQMYCLRIVGLVLIIGAMGASLHGITSLGFHCSRKNFGTEWTLWYLYRPAVGALLALIFYLIINGGLVSQVNINNKNKFFLLLGLSGLIGLFSKQALIRLRMIFDAIFASEKDEPPKNSDESGTPNKPKPQSGDGADKKQGTRDEQKENQS
jgi:hypothetical protein